MSTYRAYRGHFDFVFDKRVKHILRDCVTETTKDASGRPKMGKSKCDDGEKDIQRDLTTMKKESNCKKKVW